MKYPWLKFFPGDHLHDPAVRSVSLAARGLWVDMLCLMHQSAQPGHLSHANGNPFNEAQLARMVGSSVEEVALLLREQEESSVFSRTVEGVIYCRRMVRDAEKREKCAEAGRRGGGNPSLQVNGAGPINGTYKGERKGAHKGDIIGESKGDFALNDIKSEVRSQKSETREKDISEAKASSPSPAARGTQKFPQAVIDEIYQAYPKKKQPVAARKSIAEALTTIARQEGVTDAGVWLKARVQAYAASRANEDPRFTPYPAKWFRAGSYDEDLTETSNLPDRTNSRAQNFYPISGKTATKYDF